MNIFKEIKKATLYRYHKTLGHYALTKMQKHCHEKDDSEFRKWGLRSCEHFDKCLEILAE